MVTFEKDQAGTEERITPGDESPGG